MAIPEDHFLRRLWRAWIAFGHWIGNIMSWVWMPLFYFTFAMPFALIVKFIVNPLKIRGPQQKSYWRPKELPPLNLDWAKSQGSTPLPKK